MQQGKGFRHRKSLGQHFLRSAETARQIADFLHPVSNDAEILEIGPGGGILTRELYQVFGQRLFVSEIDERAIVLIQSDPGIHEDHILRGDFIQKDLRNVFAGDWVIVGNFPYNISSQIIFKMIEYRERIPVLVGMFQREMANRIAAEPGSKDFGVISAWAGLFYESEIVMNLGPEAFDPPPKVHSSVIRMKRRTDQVLDFDTKAYLRVIKTAFQQRRKRLSNAMKAMPGSSEALENLQLGHLRAEQVSINQYTELTKMMYPTI